MRHTGRIIGRPPPRLAWVLGVPTLVPLILSACFLLLMPLLLYRTVVPRPHLIPDREPHIDCPVPHSRRHPLSLHVDSRIVPYLLGSLKNIPVASLLPEDDLDNVVLHSEDYPLADEPSDLVDYLERESG